MKRILAGLNFPILLMGVFFILVILFDLSKSISFPYTNYCFILVLISSFFSSKQERLSGYLKFNILFAIWCGLSILWSVNNDDSIERATTVILLCMLNFSITLYSKYGLDGLKKLLFFYFLGATILLFWSLRSWDAYSLAALRTSERLQTDLMDGNFIGKMLSLASLICLYYIIKHPKNYILIALYIVFLYMVIVLKSKSALLGMLFGALFFLYIYFRGKRKVYHFAIITIAVVAIFYYMASSGFFGDAFVRFIRMFDLLKGDSDADMSTFERMYFVQLGWDYFVQSPIFGFGIGTCKQLTGGTYFHNNYIQLLAETGIVGFLLYYGMIAWLIKKIRPFIFSYDGALYFSIIIIMLIGDTNNATHYQKLTYIMYGLCYLFIMSKENKTIQ